MYNIPLGKVLGVLSKKYLNILSFQLQHLAIDRYFFPLVVIGREKLTQQQLAEKLNTDKVSIVRIVDYLSEKGMVNRKQNPNDRRGYMLEVTSKGRKTIPEIEKVMEEVNHCSLDGLHDNEVKIFYKCLENIKHNLSSISESDNIELGIKKKE